MEICRFAEGRACPAAKALLRRGDARGSSLQVILSGSCAMYFDSSESSISPQLFTEHAQLHPLPPPPRHQHMSFVGHQVAAGRRNALDHSAKSGVHTLVQMNLGPGEAIGAQRAIHNCDAELVVREGFRDIDHTVVALEETFAMEIVNPKHIISIADARLRSNDEKIRVLRAIPLYAHCTTSCLRRMADVMVRKWYPADNVVVAESGLSEEVFFTVQGQLRVVKHSGTPSQTTINVMGPGSCFGDLGVLTRKPRSHTIMTAKTCQFLGMIVATECTRFCSRLL